MRMPRGRRALTLAALACAGVVPLAACGTSASPNESGRPVVLATTTQLADLARTIGGPSFAVHQVLRPNTDPHEFEPRPSDVTAAADAKLILTSGLGLDAWADELKRQSGTTAPLVDVGSTVPVKLAGSGEEAGKTDPHWWHDPTNVVAATTTIERALISADPGGKASIVARSRAYRERVRALDAAMRACLDAVPRAQRKVVTDHDAFAYLLRRYGITYVGAAIPSQSTRAQASAGALAALERTIRRERVKAVFPESSVNRSLAERIARDTGASAQYVLHGDTLGPADGPAGTYIGMEQTNTDALVRGMTGGRRGCRFPQ